MNKRERILAASRREPTDRIPVAFWRHFPGDDQRAGDLAQATIAFQERYDFDFVKVSPSNSFAGEDW
ncbi:MAG: uroporphyrinogen decarboxylase, partial [Chloroflexi bacterium]|nr:uroporphyrinogen decarboxylase [Chloroflexota bacterium]